MRRRDAAAEREREMSLDENDHKASVLWAADCAEHVLPHFEERYPNDDRPRKAVEAGRAWARGLRLGTRGKVGECLGESGVMPDSSAMTVAQIRAAALAAHVAARDADDPAARSAARAAGHAAATAHVAEHARHAASYAIKAVTSATSHADAASAAAEERDWQVQHLPKRVGSVAFPTPGKS
jgi:hypothetical protein